MIDTICKVKLKPVSINHDGVQLLVKMKINNRVASLILDTGASRTVLDKTRAQRFLKSTKTKKHKHESVGLGGAALETHTVDLKKIQMGTVVKKNVNCLLLDLSHVNTAYEQINLKPVDGILGGDFLQDNSVVIDYLTNEMSLR